MQYMYSDICHYACVVTGFTWDFGRYLNNCHFVKSEMLLDVSLAIDDFVVSFPDKVVSVKMSDEIIRHSKCRYFELHHFTNKSSFELYYTARQGKMATILQTTIRDVFPFEFYWMQIMMDDSKFIEVWVKLTIFFSIDTGDDSVTNNYMSKRSVKWIKHHWFTSRLLW